MSNRAKNIIVLIALFTLVIILLTGVIGVAIGKNSQSKSFEVYVDDGPIDYYANNKSKEDIMMFSLAVSKVFRGFFGSDDGVNNFVKKVTAAMSKARIPSDKLVIMGVEIAKINLADLILGGNVNVTEEELKDFIDKNNSSQIASYVNKFLDTTTLTEEEFSRFLYQYLRTNGSDEYKNQLNIIGREDFITFFANTVYLVTLIDELKADDGGAMVTASALQAGLYQLGCSYVRIIDKVGLGTMQKLLGFDWVFSLKEEDKDNAEKVKILAQVNEYNAKLTNRVSYTFYYFGKIMQRIELATLRDVLTASKLQPSKGKDDLTIYGNQQLAKTVLNGIKGSFNMSSVTGIGDLDTFFDGLQEFLINANNLRRVLNNEVVDDKYNEEVVTKLAKSQSALEKLASADYTLEQISSLDGEVRKQLLDSVKTVWDMQYLSEKLLANMIFLWERNILNRGIMTV